MVALRFVAMKQAQVVDNAFVLDTFGDGAQVESPRKLDDGANDRRVVCRRPLSYDFARAIHGSRSSR